MREVSIKANILSHHISIWASPLSTNTPEQRLQRSYTRPRWRRLSIPTSATYSLGYLSTNYAGDERFEGYTCGHRPFSFGCTTAYADWLGPGDPRRHRRGYTGVDSSTTFIITDCLPSTLASIDPLTTKAGKQYQISFFQCSGWSCPEGEGSMCRCCGMGWWWILDPSLAIRGGIAPSLLL